MEIFWTTALSFSKFTERIFRGFVQQMADRIAQGQARYGSPNRRKQYVKRAQMELEVYTQTGNAEHLINTANYCFLETVDPAHPKFHIDPTVESATRGKKGIKDLTQ